MEHARRSAAVLAAALILLSSVAATPGQDEAARRRQQQQQQAQQQAQQRQADQQRQRQRALDQQRALQQQWAESSRRVGGRFGRNDLLLGPSASGSLSALQRARGGVIITDDKNRDGRLMTDVIRDRLQTAARTGRQIHFDLTKMSDLRNALAGKGRYAGAVTTMELRFLRDHWNEFRTKPKFYRAGKQVPPPWQTIPRQQTQSIR